MIPDGFTPHLRKSKFTEPWEPLYARQDECQVSLGTVLRDVHCNSRGLVHGGFIAAIADNAMGLTCGIALKSASRDVNGLVTITLTTDYVGSARIGQWFETNSSVVKAGGSLCFAQSLLMADGAVIARANATFKVLSGSA